MIIPCYIAAACCQFQLSIMVLILLLMPLHCVWWEEPTISEFGKMGMEGGKAKGPFLFHKIQLLHIFVAVYIHLEPLSGSQKLHHIYIAGR